MNELKHLLYKELYRKSLYEFVKAFWSTCEPAPLIDGLLIKFYCETFQYMCRRWVGYKEIKINIPNIHENETIIDIREDKQNININVPPRHTKSMIFNVLGPVWLECNYPVKVASVSHTIGLAEEMNGKRVKILNSEKFKFFFGDEIKIIRNSRGKLIDNRGGELYSVAREAFTGYGADLIINDDLTNAETAKRDKEEMNSAWSYYQNTMPSRINDRNKYIIMNIQQRLAPNDITGHIINETELASSYLFIVLPAIFEKITYLVFPISGIVHKFKIGDSLWPERFGDYSSIKLETGESVFETQYQQHPIVSDKTVIKDSMIIEKDEPLCPGIDNADIIYASHDFPVKDKETSDFLGSILAYRTNSTLYVIDCLEIRMAFVKSVEYVKTLDDTYPGIIQIIEDKANGSPILQQLQDEVAGMQAYQPGTASKTQRLESASLYMASGNVVLVKTEFDTISQTYRLSPQLQKLKRRLLDFPYVQHDDIIDAFDMTVLFAFMDKRYFVYARSFNDLNITNDLKHDYSTVFFNKEGDIWKVLNIGINYSAETKLIVLQENRFKASIEEGINKLKELYPKSSVFIDCSDNDGLVGLSASKINITKYNIEDFDKSVASLNFAFAKNLVLLSKDCKLLKSDIENFKFSKSKDENVKYLTTKDGFVHCIRTSMVYYGISI